MHTKRFAFYERSLLDPHTDTHTHTLAHLKHMVDDEWVMTVRLEVRRSVDGTGPNSRAGVNSTIANRSI